MDQENTKSLNTLISNNTTPRRNSSSTLKDGNSETPIKGSGRSVSSVCGSSSVRRSNRLQKRVDVKQDDAVARTPQLGAPGGTPYLLRSKSREVMSSMEESLRRNAVEMPPLNLTSTGYLGVSSEFYRVGTERDLGGDNQSHEFENSGESSNMYSTPRKRARGVEVNGTCENARSGLNRDFEPGGSSSQARSCSSRRKGGSNVKSTPLSKSRRIGEEDSAAKDRKSILKQYDPDGINTAMVNIKTPKSQKKVQFGTKNLIIIDENKQDMNINRLITESDNDETSRDGDVGSSGTHHLDGGLVDGRMSILSELDDAGTGQIYSFPSLEELINTRKDEDDGQSSKPYVSSGVVEVEVSGKNGGMKCGYLFDQTSNLEHFDRSEYAAGDGSASRSRSQEDGDRVRIYETSRLGGVQEEDNVEKSLELTDQINISDYSINYRDSIAPNLPGAFLSVVMKNLSSVNFPEEGGSQELEDEIRIPELEMDVSAPTLLEEVCEAEEKSVLNTGVEDSSQDHPEGILEKDSMIDASKTERTEMKDHVEPEQKESQEYQQVQEELNSNHEEIEKNHPVPSVCESELKVTEVGKDLENHQIESFETQQIVLTETLTILKDGNNRLSSILITPRRSNHGNPGYINKLSPSSESLLKSLNNTKSILNITPQGYTWEEFQTVLNLNYTMEHYFGILDFEESGNRIKDGVVEEGMDGGGLLLLDLESILKNEGVDEGQVVKKEGVRNGVRVEDVLSRYSSEVVKSVRTQIWNELEKNTLVKEFNNQERYSDGLLRFPASEIATVMAIIVNKSRYGGKNDERVKNELFERISKYFFVEDGRNIFFKKAKIDWKEKVVFPLKSLLISKYEEVQRMFMSKHERLMNNRNRIQNSNVLLSTLESCKISEMHVHETYWNAVRIVHDNINNYKGEIERLRSYMGMMERKKSNISRLLLKEEELYASLLMELNSWNVKKNSLRYHLTDLRIKEEFAGFTWDLFTINKFQTVIILNNSCNNRSNLVRVRVSIEWNMDESSNLFVSGESCDHSPPITLKVELLQDREKEKKGWGCGEERDEDAGSSRYNDLQLQLALVNNQRLEDKIYQAYIEVIERTLNLRLMDMYLDFKRQSRMNNSTLIELIRGMFQSCIVLLWRLESIVFEILNIIKVFNLAIIDIIDKNVLVLNIPILVGVSDEGGVRRIGFGERSEHSSSHHFFSSSSSPVSPLFGGVVNSASSPLTPNSFTSNNSHSPHLLMASRPVISIKFNITNSLFKSVGTLVNSIEDISIYNTSEEVTKDMTRVFKDQIEEVTGSRCEVDCSTTATWRNSAVYVGYNCLLSVIQNTIQEGGRNQLIWKRPLEKFAPRLLNAVQISKLHKNF